MIRRSPAWRYSYTVLSSPTTIVTSGPVDSRSASDAAAMVATLASADANNQRCAFLFRATANICCDRVHNVPILTQFMTNDKPLVLVDGSSYLFRAFHALPSLSTTDGHPTGAVRGVIGMLRRLAKDYAGSAIAVVLARQGGAFA